jgi:hypothetical protein
MFILPGDTQMHTLVSQLTTTFVDDAIELVKGFGKIIVHIATAPIERIANACDVGGVLARRQSARRPRATTKARVRAARGRARCLRSPPCTI